MIVKIAIALLLVSPVAYAQVVALPGANFPACNASNDTREIIIDDPVDDGQCGPPGLGTANPHVCICDGTTSTWRADFPDNHELVAVDSIGRVGIGTKTQVSTLHVVGVNGLCVETTDTGCNAGAGNLFVAGNGTFQDSTAGGTVSVNLVNTSTAAGSSARVKLETFGDGDTYVRFEIDGAQFWAVGIDNSISDNFSFTPSSVLGTSATLTLTTGGNVSIGTTAPDGKLHVHTATAGSVTAAGAADDLVVENSAAGGISILSPDANSSLLYFGSVTDNRGAFLSWKHDDDLLRVATDKAGAEIAFLTAASVEAVRIDSSGLVGIGTTAPNEALTVEGVISLDEVSAPTTTSGYGKVWTNDDDELHFMDGAGVEHIVTASYAEISAIDNATETVIGSAGVAVQVTIFDTNGPALQLVPDHTNDHITIDITGDYQVTSVSTINSVSGSSSRLELTVQKNNGATDVGSCHSNHNITGGGGHSDAVPMSCLATLTAGDTIEVWLENETNTQNYVVEDIDLSIVRLDL